VRVAAGMSETGFSRRRSPRVVISRKRYVVITKNGEVRPGVLLHFR